MSKWKYCDACESPVILTEEECCPMCGKDGDEMPMTITEKMQTVSASEFGVRIAEAFLSSRSSTTTFFVQQAFKDCHDDNGLMWGPFEEMFERLKEENERQSTK
jgi:hypothetical protein